MIRLIYQCKQTNAVETHCWVRRCCRREGAGEDWAAVLLWDDWVGLAVRVACVDEACRQRCRAGSVGKA